MRRLIGIFSAALMAVCAASQAQAQGLPPPGGIEGIGVSAHGPTAGDFAQMEAAGIKIVRADMNWAMVEKQRGQYDWSHFDWFTAQLRQHHMRPLFILAYGNSLYSSSTRTFRHNVPADTPNAPADPASRAAYVRFAATAAARYASFAPIWEIWNEPNVKYFWAPAEDPAAYAALAAPSCKAIRDADPTATVIGPGSGEAFQPAGADPKWLIGFIRTGGWTCFDAVSAHPYTVPAQLDDIPSAWARMRQLMASVSNARVNVVASEWGQSAVKEFSEKAQGSYTARMMLLDMAAGVPITVYYDWRDDNNPRDPDTDQAHFGLIHSDGSPKPSLIALQTLTRTLAGYHSVCQARLGPGQIGLIFRSQVGDLLAAWDSTAPDSGSGGLTAALLTRAARGLGVDAFGGPRNLKSGLSPVPVYVPIARSSISCF